MRAEIVIVGAGVYGATIAWELARRGRDVLVLEAQHIASGASGGLGKRGVRANGRDRRELPLMRRTYDIWPTLAETLDADIGFERIGHLELIERPDDATRAAVRTVEQVRHGIPTELVEGGRLRMLEPETADTIRAALYCPLDGVADHSATTQAYARAAQRHGARFVEQTAVTQLISDAGRVRSVLTADGDHIDIGAVVVVVANQNTADLVSSLGARYPAVPVMPQVLVTAPLTTPLVRHLIGHSHRRLAMKTLPDGAVMITGGWLGVWNAERGVGEPVAEQIAGNLDEAIAVFPRLRDATIAVAVADRVESIAADLVPIIDIAPHATNCLFATGWSGHGWAIAPAVAELMAIWVIRGERPAPLAPFALSRFG